MFTFNLIHDLIVLAIGFFLIYCLRGFFEGLARGIFSTKPLRGKFGWPSLILGILFVYLIFYLNHWFN